jgi:hypothetical protein
MKRLNGTVRRVLMTAVVGGCAAAVIGGVSLAHAGGSSSDRTLRLTEIQTAGKFVSISHIQRGAPGDEFMFHSKLMNNAGDRVGSLDVFCVLVMGGKLQCQGTFRLPGGTISGSALSGQSNLVTHISITGGTGRYDHARGQVTTTSEGQNSDVSKDVIDLD